MDTIKKKANTEKNHIDKYYNDAFLQQSERLEEPK